MGLSVTERRRRVLVLMAARLCRLGGGETNAHSGLSGGEEEMRIADVLHEQEGEEQSRNRSSTAAIANSNNSSNGSSRRRRGGCRGRVSSPSPRFLLSRWLPSRQFMRCKTCEEYKEEVVKEQVGEESGEVSGPSSLGSNAGAHRSVSADREEEIISNRAAMASTSEGRDGPVVPEERSVQGPGWRPEQTYLNIGMGAGLVFLLTRSVTEFNKMIELRSEMEILLKEMKTVMQKKDEMSNTVDLKNNHACCSSGSCGNMELCNDLSIHDCNTDPCLELLDSSCNAELDGHSICNKGHRGKKSPRIDQMEEELKSELELLQTNLDNQESSELLGVEMPCGRTDLSESFSVSLGEHPEHKEQIEEYEEDTRDNYGVCPHELTRRLQELLETQQQERIAELESALALAQIKIREKEMEACWWRDTARLVTQHKQETMFR